jgi:amino acid adenylation domain-containing protein
MVPPVVRYLLSHLLESWAQATPAAEAVVDRERSLSYGELDAQANRVAGALRALGVRRGDRVALYLEKSLEAVVAIYGILKAGAAYVPLDPQAPPARLGYIARDAGVRVLVSAAAQALGWGPVHAGAPELSAVLLLGPEGPALEAPAGLRIVGAAELAEHPSESPSVRAIDADLAYILYTSGSTGTPKGVMLTHRNCLAFVEWAAAEFGLTAQDRVSSHAPLHFDLSTFDLYAAALAGAPVVLVPAGVSVFPSQVRAFIESAGITTWYSVPSILTMLVLRGGLQGGELPALRTLLFAGEVFPTAHLRRLSELLPHVRLANLFGPTETNVCTWWEVPRPLPPGDEAIPIGRAIANVDAFAVTEDGRRAAPGEVGELYVRGPTVMQGYLGDPERTALRLVPDPFGGVLAQPVYRTGDLVREAPDGDYRFIGRRDDQIKSRGYRIELGDVEAAIYAHPLVDECAVVAIPDDVVTNRLQAFLAVHGELAGSELQRFCAERIPAYMIPEHFHFASTLPRTSTGKVDRRALAEQARSVA